MNEEFLRSMAGCGNYEAMSCEALECYKRTKKKKHCFASIGLVYGQYCATKSGLQKCREYVSRVSHLAETEDEELLCIDVLKETGEVLSLGFLEHFPQDRLIVPILDSHAANKEYTVGVEKAIGWIQKSERVDWDVLRRVAEFAEKSQGESAKKALENRKQFKKEKTRDNLLSSIYIGLFSASADETVVGIEEYAELFSKKRFFVGDIHFLFNSAPASKQKEMVEKARQSPVLREKLPHTIAAGWRGRPESYTDERAFSVDLIDAAKKSEPVWGEVGPLVLHMARKWTGFSEETRVVCVFACVELGLFELGKKIFATLETKHNQRNTLSYLVLDFCQVFGDVDLLLEQGKAHLSLIKKTIGQVGSSVLDAVHKRKYVLLSSVVCFGTLLSRSLQAEAIRAEIAALNARKTWSSSDAVGYVHEYLLEGQRGDLIDIRNRKIGKELLPLGGISELCCWRGSEGYPSIEKRRELFQLVSLVSAKKKEGRVEESLFGSFLERRRQQSAVQESTRWRYAECSSLAESVDACLDQCLLCLVIGDRCLAKRLHSEVTQNMDRIEKWMEDDRTRAELRGLESKACEDLFVFEWTENLRRNRKLLDGCEKILRLNGAR
ncbi:MAG: uncharacterized protein A8A55_1142 [Amphiamblys sp. WSBS2006]|nr:MAG: uncharacterized protein A8A55_1142 [Amphiamblys sp. WSBS2006]